MNRGAEAGIPCRRSSSTCPSSWTSSRTTNPTAKRQPQIHEYAAIETSIDPDVTKSLNLKSASTSALNLKMSKPTAAIGAQSFRPSSRSRPCGWIGS